MPACRGRTCLTENKSSNTGDNIRFTKQLLADLNLELATFIVVQKPTWKGMRPFELWPEKEVIVVAKSHSEYLRSYSNGSLSDDVICHGCDLQRIRLYPARAFQSNGCSAACGRLRQLVAAGFTKFDQP
jgi:hypothetical protein